MLLQLDLVNLLNVLAQLAELRLESALCWRYDLLLFERDSLAEEVDQGRHAGYNYEITEAEHKERDDSHVLHVWFLGHFFEFSLFPEVDLKNGKERSPVVEKALHVDREDKPEADRERKCHQ